MSIKEYELNKVHVGAIAEKKYIFIYFKSCFITMKLTIVLS